MDIPRSALILGLAGVLPFLWGALTSLAPGIGQAALPILGPRLIGPFVQLQYGIVILAFMSGVLWGFATRAGDRQTLCYTLSVLPALWAFFATGAGATSTALSLIAGFLGLLALDYKFSRWGLTPTWWMSLRILLTALVVISLALGIQI